MQFTLNGDIWDVRYARWNSEALVDRTGELRLATTDPDTRIIRISDKVNGTLLARVLIHEIGHAIMVSYDLIPELHRMVKPEYWIEAEEWVCNFIADYGMTVYDRASKILGKSALACVPEAMSRLVA